MKAKRSDITPALLLRILPALRQMVRFPSMPAKNISFQTGIELTDIYAYTEIYGRPKHADLARIEREIEEGVAPAPQPATAEQLAQKRGGFDNPQPPRMPASSAAKAETASTAETQDVKKVAPPLLWTGKQIHAPAFARYRPVLESLASSSLQKGSAYQACQAADVPFSAFANYCRSWFGDISLSVLQPETIRAFLAWANSELAKRNGHIASAVPSTGLKVSLGTSTRSGEKLPTAPAEMTITYSARNEAAVDIVRGLREKYDAVVMQTFEQRNQLERETLTAQAKRDAADEILAAIGGAS